ncbi:MAG: hypothetical protein J1E61_05970 [Lachnospiraceae bacterium]|nr:hypothetical protein [Lachnospiraceae bacterium]
MSGSSVSVNYNIRPCKSIERRMMCEMISRLVAFDQICNYRYIGMGAKYFVDFSLFHKEFGINEMYSMEINSDKKNKERFEFNKPFNCINMMFGKASDILNSSRLKWNNKKNIIWLDYDGGITGEQLQDVENCVGKVDSGSVIFISFNSDLGNEFQQKSPNEKLKMYCSRIDNEALVKCIKPKDMSKEKIYQTTNKMFDMVVRNKILERNRTILSENEKYQCQQLVYFKYNDSKAIMLTMGWILYKNKDAKKYANCNFSELEFYNDSYTPYDITVPNFTYKELTVLNRNMPNITYPIKEAQFLLKEEIETYQKIYRYYPAIFETSVVL